MIDYHALILLLYDTSRILSGLLAAVVKSTFCCVFCLGSNSDCVMSWHLTSASSSVPLRLSVFNSKVV